MIWIAELTADDVLVGFKRVEAAPPGAVIVPANCDLKTDGRYRYSRNAQTFEPIPAVVAAKGDTALVNQMIAAVLVGIADRASTPQAVLDQADFIEKTAPGHVRKLRRDWAARAGDLPKGN